MLSIKEATDLIAFIDYTCPGKCPLKAIKGGYDAEGSLLSRKARQARLALNRFLAEKQKEVYEFYIIKGKQASPVDIRSAMTEWHFSTSVSYTHLTLPTILLV